MRLRQNKSVNCSPSCWCCSICFRRLSVVFRQLKARARKPPKERSTPSTSAAASNVLPSSPAAAAQSTASGVPVHVLDCSLSQVEESPTPRKTALKRKLCYAEGQLRSCRKRIKVLMQSKRRLQKRNADLKAVIEGSHWWHEKKWHHLFWKPVCSTERSWWCKWPYYYYYRLLRHAGST